MTISFFICLTIFSKVVSRKCQSCSSFPQPTLSTSLNSSLCKPLASYDVCIWNASEQEQKFAEIIELFNDKPYSKNASDKCKNAFLAYSCAVSYPSCSKDHLESLDTCMDVCTNFYTACGFPIEDGTEICSSIHLNIRSSSFGSKRTNQGYSDCTYTDVDLLPPVSPLTALTQSNSAHPQDPNKNPISLPNNEAPPSNPSHSQSSAFTSKAPVMFCIFASAIPIISSILF